MIFQNSTRIISLLLLLLLPGACKKSDNSSLKKKTLFFIDYRNLSGGKDGIAVMELDPESPDFGKIINKTELGMEYSPITYTLTEMKKDYLLLPWEVDFCMN